MKYLSLVLLSCLILTHCKRKAEIVVGKNAFITATILNVRKTSDSKAKILGSLKMGEEVLVISKSETQETVGDKTNFWYKIKSSQVEGWAFGSYLAPDLEAAQEAILELLTGTYNYCDYPVNTNCSNTLRIDGEKFIERKFDWYFGISDKLEGRTEANFGSVVLHVTSRLMRPEVYISYPNSEEERSAYKNAYFRHSTSEDYLVKLSDYNEKEDNKYYFYKCNENILLRLDKVGQEEACSTGYAYVKE